MHTHVAHRRYTEVGEIASHNPIPVHDIAMMTMAARSCPIKFPVSKLLQSGEGAEQAVRTMRTSHRTFLSASSCVACCRCAALAGALSAAADLSSLTDMPLFGNCGEVGSGELVIGPSSVCSTLRTNMTCCAGETAAAFSSTRADAEKGRGVGSTGPSSYGRGNGKAGRAGTLIAWSSENRRVLNLQTGVVSSAVAAKLQSAKETRT